MTELLTAHVAGDAVRLPDPERGTAVVAERYGKARAIILHPEDFEDLVAVSRRETRRRLASQTMRLSRVAAAAQHRDDDEQYDLDDIPLEHATA